MFLITAPQRGKITLPVVSAQTGVLGFHKKISFQVFKVKIKIKQETQSDCTRLYHQKEEYFMTYNVLNGSNNWW